MESAELLDLLGNANRRRILRLLAHKPCYVTEISEYLGVSPKAVIDHLEKLSAAGLIDSRTDDQRRKYFSISRNLRLEVRVSPYEFGTRSAYPARSGLDLSTCRHLSISMQDTSGDNLRDLAAELTALEQLENELSLAQRWVHGQLTDVHDRFEDRDEEGRLYAEIISELATGPKHTPEVARAVEAPTELVENALETLADAAVVERSDNGWQLLVADR
jgi:ArsR family transcriptional regulator